jgi:outer membrane protein assembly factor BamD
MRKLPVLFIVLILLASCAKKIPPMESFDPDNTFKEANEMIEKKRYEEARRLLGNIRNRDTTMQYGPLAQLRIADSHMEEDEPEIAVDEYRIFLDEQPRHKYASYAQYRIGMVYYELITGPDQGFEAAVHALEEFQKLMDLYPRNPYRESVLLKMERCREIIAEHEFIVGDFYFKKKAYRGAIKRLTDLLDDFPMYQHRDQVYYRLAVSKKALGNDDVADYYLRMLREAYPKSKLIGKIQKEFDKIMGNRVKTKED